MELTRTLAQWVADLRFGALPEAVVHQVRRTILDYLCAALAGSTTAVSRGVLDYFAAGETGGRATIVGSERRLSPASAAFVNGTSAHGLEIDDGYTQGSFHPGAPTLPAVLAAAEIHGAAPERLITAAAAALEVGCRIAAAGHPATWRRGFHNTAIAGVFGAAAGCARVLGHDGRRTIDTLGLAGSFAGGLFEFLGSGAEVKRLHPGKAARDGLVSAELAGRGITGPATVLEGRAGYFEAFAGGEHDADRVAGGLGRHWALESTYVKPYPCCRHLHGPIDAVLALRAEGALAPGGLEAVQVQTYAVAARHDHRSVDEFLDAQMSIPYAVAVALRYGRVGIAEFAPQIRRDPEVRRLVALVEVAVGADCEADYPKMRPARVTLRWRDGRERALRVDWPYGEPETPVSDAALAEKFHNVCDPVAGRERCDRIIERAWALDDLPGLFASLRLPAESLAPAVA
jgi:2-methylcitrate dehydratase PrpD